MLQYKWGGSLGEGKNKKQGDKRRLDAAKVTEGDWAKAWKSYWKSSFYVPASLYPEDTFLEIESESCTWFWLLLFQTWSRVDFAHQMSMSVYLPGSQPNIYDTCKTNSILVLSLWIFICPRFRPHQDADPEKPRVAALIDRLISFKNNDHGAWVRGGDILIQNSG